MKTYPLSETPLTVFIISKIFICVHENWGRMKGGQEPEESHNIYHNNIMISNKYQYCLAFSYIQYVLVIKYFNQQKHLLMNVVNL